jgi:hypothetical protein
LKGSYTVRCAEIDHVTYFDRRKGLSGGQRLGKVTVVEAVVEAEWLLERVEVLV